MLVRTPISLWALLAAGLAARLLVVHWSSGIELILDEVNYLDYGAHLLENGRLPGAFRPPGYPGFIALTQAVFGEDPAAIRAAQALVATFAGWLCFHWLRPHIGHTGALVSAALWCMHPVLIGFTHLLWTETLFLSLLIAFFHAATPAGSLTLRRTALAGLIYGFAALTRSVLTPFAWLAPLFVVIQPAAWRLRERPVLRAAVFLAAFGLTVAPWAAHNIEVEERFIVTETTNGYNLWKGNTPWEHPFATEAPQYPGPVVSIPMFPYEGSGPKLNAICEAKHQGEDPFTRWHLSRCARSMALDYIQSDFLGFLTRGPTKLAHAFHPSNLISRHYWLGIYKHFPSAWAPLLIWGTAACTYIILGLGLWGFIRARTAPLPVMLLGVAMAQAAVIFITFGNTRFRLPIVLVAIALAGWGFARPPKGETNES